MSMTVIIIQCLINIQHFLQSVASSLHYCIVVRPGSPFSTTSLSSYIMPTFICIDRMHSNFASLDYQ